MDPAKTALLEASLDQLVELHLLDGSRLLAKPLFVYTGEDNPDVFVLPVEQAPDGSLTVAQAGLSILLAELVDVRIAHPPA